VAVPVARSLPGRRRSTARGQHRPSPKRNATAMDASDLPWCPVSQVLRIVPAPHRVHRKARQRAMAGRRFRGSAMRPTVRSTSVKSKELAGGDTGLAPGPPGTRRPGFSQWSGGMDSLERANHAAHARIDTRYLDALEATLVHEVERARRGFGPFAEALEHQHRDRRAVPAVPPGPPGPRPRSCRGACARRRPHRAARDALRCAHARLAPLMTARKHHDCVERLALPRPAGCRRAAGPQRVAAIH